MVTSSNQEILEFVKIQWQLSNLREINNENGSLPRNISGQKSIVLPENYILQVEQMYDIATSKYKQLQNIRNTHFSEVEATEEQKMEQWKCPKKRMIQLKLTDGIQDIIGIEYNPMSILNEMLLPGYKVMIIGPVRCRRGVLLLEEKKLKKIGGEVDSLLIPNALENVLARALNVEENPDPYGDNELKSNNIVQREEPANELENIFEDEFEINFEEVSEIENTHRKSQKQPNVNTMQVEAMQKNPFTNINIENTSNYSCTVQAERKNVIVNNVEKKNDHRSSEEIILDDDDYFLEMVDEGQLIESQPEQKMSVRAPFRALPKEEDDDLIIINDDDMVEEIKHENMNKSVVKQEISSRSNSPWFMNKTNSSKNASTSRSCVQSTDTTMPSIGAKRLIPMSPSDRVIKKKGRIDRKITEFTNRSSSPDVKLCDFIYDINNDIITEKTIKTICGRVEVLGKLSKQNTSWNLDATLVDGTGKIEVTFTNEVLENLLGFSVQQFSLKKKLKKNPEIELELRTSFRNAERRIKTLHDLLELELDINKKPTVIKIIDITQDKRELIEKQLQSFLRKNNI
nr:recQ-mediated genome instability protein 1-like isoform X2 [Megalopta genalis]